MRFDNDRNARNADAQRTVELAAWEQQLSEEKAKLGKEKEQLSDWQKQLNAESERSKVDPLLEEKRAKAIDGLRADLQKKIDSGEIRVSKKKTGRDDPDSSGADSHAASSISASSVSMTATLLSSAADSDDASSNSGSSVSTSTMSLSSLSP